MEVTFLPGLENLGERLLAKKRDEAARRGETVWDAYMRRKRWVALPCWGRPAGIGRGGWHGPACRRPEASCASLHGRCEQPTALQAANHHVSMSLVWCANRLSTCSLVLMQREEGGGQAHGAARGR